jgi:hypothetical protein
MEVNQSNLNPLDGGMDQSKPQTKDGLQGKGSLEQQIQRKKICE